VVNRSNIEATKLFFRRAAGSGSGRFTAPLSDGVAAVHGSSGIGGGASPELAGGVSSGAGMPMAEDGRKLLIDYELVSNQNVIDRIGMGASSDLGAHLLPRL
jgi:hypothetical protein